MLVVRRPAVGVREVAAEAMLGRVAGLAGDNWLGRGSTGTPDGSADPQRQVTVMNARVAALVAGGMDRVPLAGDQLYVDLDLSVGNSTLAPSEYRSPVLGLIFLAYAEHRFDEVRPEIEAKATARRPVSVDDYRALRRY